MPVLIDLLLLGCLIGGLAAFHIASLPADAALILAGGAFASLGSWRGVLSWGFLAHCIVSGYFFRCILLYLLGTDRVKLVAFNDAVIGLAAIGVATLARHALRGHTAAGGTAGEALHHEESYSAGDPCDGEAVSAQTVGTSPTSQDETETPPVRSPPQFTLRAFFVCSAACAGLLYVSVVSDPAWAYWAVVLGLLWWLLAACARLIQLGGGEKG